MNRLRISFKIAVLFSIAWWVSPVAAQQLLSQSTFHSIGYRLLLPPGYDADSSSATEVRYRPAGGNWQPGIPASRLSLSEFRGCLFQLEPSTAYELEVTLVDTFPVFKKETLTAAVTTLAVPEIEPSGNLKWVSPNGSGSVYSETSPGNLKTLLSAGLPCGTTVLLKGGTYVLGDMVLNLTQDCPEGTPISVMAAPGEQPVLDGGYYATYNWMQGAGDTNIWWTVLPTHLDFNALCLVDGERMYPYAFLTPSAIDPSYPSLWTLGYGLSGFYRNKSNQVFVKTLDHKNLNGSQVVFSQKFSCLTVNGNNKNIRLRIKGIQFKNYGKGSCSKDFLGNPTECYPSSTMRFMDASGVVIDSCSFDFCNFPVRFEGNCNDNLVMRCSITDGTGYWSHAAFKRTIDVVNWLLDPSCGTYGRYLENIGIHFRPAPGQSVQRNVVWKNTVRGVVTGIGLGIGNGSVMEESDMAENQVSWCFDGIDAIGEHRNARIWGNSIGHCPVGTSLISGDQVPVYIFRNVYHHLDQRQNYQNDPYFVDCEDNHTHQSWATALKLNAGSEARTSDHIYFVHNTVHGIDTLSFNLYLWQPTWKSLQLRNNVFYTEGMANFFFDGVNDQPTYGFESVGDNVLSVSGGPIGIVRPQHGEPVCMEYYNAEALELNLSAITGSPFIRLKGTFSEQPYFIDPESSNFRLLPSSPLIDRGVAVPGFNNQYEGAAPDIGAYETPGGGGVPVRPVPTAADEMDVFPNPSSGTLFVRLAIGGSAARFQVWDAQGRLRAEKEANGLQPGIQLLEMDFSGLPPGVYYLKILPAGQAGVCRKVVLVGGPFSP